MKFILSAGTAAAALLLYMLRTANTIKEKRHTIHLETEEGFRPFRLIFIADIHRKKLPNDFLDFQVDAIIIGGDLTERGVPMNRTADNLRILSKAAPVYFVWGNHDPNIGERSLRKLLDHFNVKIMENESVELFGQSHLKLVGIDYCSDRDFKLEKAFANVQNSDTVLFAAHSPAIFKYIKTPAAPALLMAGHLHGGQIRFGRIGLYKNGSLRKKGSRYELITNGYGTSSLPLRLGAEAQYHVLDILPKMKKGLQ